MLQGSLATSTTSSTYVTGELSNHSVVHVTGEPSNYHCYSVHTCVQPALLVVRVLQESLATIVWYMLQGSLSNYHCYSVVHVTGEPSN
jgi:hypothetical protein